MMTEGTNLLVLTISAFGAHLGGPEGREVSHYVVVIDRFYCLISYRDIPFTSLWKPVIDGGMRLRIMEMRTICWERIYFTELSQL